MRSRMAMLTLVPDVEDREERFVLPVFGRETDAGNHCVGRTAERE